MRTKRFLQMAGVLALAGALCLGCANKSAEQKKEHTKKTPAAGNSDPGEKPVAVKAEKPAGDIIAAPGPFDALCDRVHDQMRESGASDDDLAALRSYCGKAGRIYEKSGKDATADIQAIEQECDAEKEAGVRLDCYNIRILEASTRN